jgi:prolyl 4-hydroxylase
MILLLFLLILVWYMIPTYRDPVVKKKFLTDEERAHIMKKAEGSLKVSTVGKSRDVDESVRKSETAWLTGEDPVVKRVMERCVRHTDRPLRNCEHLQVLRYRPGGYYKPHQDAFMDENKRMYTFILALNDDYEGGETAFPNLDKTYKLEAGDALFFDTLDNYELDTSKALHGGQPVKSGEKWICNLWVRKHPV